MASAYGIAVVVLLGTAVLADDVTIGEFGVANRIADILINDNDDFVNLDSLYAPDHFTVIQDVLFFTAHNGTQEGVYMLNSVVADTPQFLDMGFDEFEATDHIDPFGDDTILVFTGETAYTFAISTQTTVPVTLPEDAEFLLVKENPFLQKAEYLYFIATTANVGFALFKTDGVTVSLVADLFADAFLFPTRLSSVGDYIIATGVVDFTDGDGNTVEVVRVFYSQGTNETTGHLADIPDDFVLNVDIVEPFISVGNSLLIPGQNNGGAAGQIIVVDGDNLAVSVLVDNLETIDAIMQWNVTHAVVLVNSDEIWLTNGSELSMIDQLEENSADHVSIPHSFFHNKLYFATEEFIYATDTETVFKLDHDSFATPRYFTILDATLYFVADKDGNPELWMINQDNDVVTMVTIDWPNDMSLLRTVVAGAETEFSSNAQAMYAFDGSLVFSAEDEFGYEPWAVSRRSSEKNAPTSNALAKAGISTYASDLVVVSSLFVFSFI